MSVARFCEPTLIDYAVKRGELFRLNDANSKHARVRRVRDGDPAVIFSGQGGEWLGKLRFELGKAKASVELEVCNLENRMPVLHQTLVVALCAPQKMAEIVQKAVELGVNRIIPVVSQYSVSMSRCEMGGAKYTRYCNIAIAACEQSGRNLLPEILQPCTLVEFWQKYAQSCTHVFMLHPYAQDSLRQALPTLERQSKVAWLVGPEGGWSEGEVRYFQSFSVRCVRAWSGILRVETACSAVLAQGAMWFEAH